MPHSIAFAGLAPRERYKLLTATIIPRPIALVTSVDGAGTVNAAPFSFFNVFGEDPPTIVLGLQHKPPAAGGEHAPKDTTRNIAATGVFVVNLVDEEIAAAMNVCAVDFPPEISEVAEAGLTLAPGIDVPVPHLAEAPFAYECRRIASLAFGPDREILIGEALRLHARDGLLDPASMRIRAEAYRPVGRLFGDGYARQGDRFELKRETFEERRQRTHR